MKGVLVVDLPDDERIAAKHELVRQRDAIPMCP